MNNWIRNGMRFKFRAAARPADTLYRVDSFEIIGGCMPPTARVQVSAIRRDGKLRVNRLGFGGNLIEGSFVEHP